METRLKSSRHGGFILMAAVFLGTMLFSTVALAAGEEPKDKTGTDPRGFGSKFMPY